MHDRSISKFTQHGLFRFTDLRTTSLINDIKVQTYFLLKLRLICVLFASLQELWIESLRMLIICFIVSKAFAMWKLSGCPASVYFESCYGNKQSIFNLFFLCFVFCQFLPLEKVWAIWMIYARNISIHQVILQLDYNQLLQNCWKFNNFKKRFREKAKTTDI